MELSNKPFIHLEPEINIIFMMQIHVQLSELMKQCMTF